MKTLPFLARFDGAIHVGQKTCAARTRKYGEPGERLVTPTGAVIELREVEKVRLDTVRDHYWRDEGCMSPDDFEFVWSSIHPRKGFKPDQEVWLHRFVLVQGDGFDEAVHQGGTDA